MRISHKREQVLQDDTEEKGGRTSRRLLSLAHLTALDASPPELVQAAARAGFDAVGLRLVPPHPNDPVFPLVNDPGLKRQTMNALRGTGIRVLDIEALWLWPHTEIARFQPALEAGAELGAHYLLVVGNDPDAGRQADNFHALSELADAHGLQPMIEFISYCTIGTIDAARKLAEQSSGGRAGVLIDVLHYARTGATSADLAALDPGMLGYVQLCDAPAGAPPADRLRTEAREDRLFPGEGGLPLAELLAGLPEATAISVEAPHRLHAGLAPTERARLALAATRRLLEGLDENNPDRLRHPAPAKQRDDA